MAGRGARGARRARRRSSSQNFLRSGTLVRELVRDAGVAPGDVVVEIGAGGGRLTQELALAAARVYAVEIDPVWAARLRERFAATGTVRVVEHDFTTWRLPAEPFTVVANLPFSGSAAILGRLLDDPAVELRRADLVLEWGAACKRARVWPSTLRGAYWGAWYEFSIARRLPGVLFEPAASVDAGVLTARRRPRPLVAAEDAVAFSAFVRAGFRPGARDLRGALSSFASRRELNRLLDRLGALRDASARDLDGHQWASLFALVRSLRPAVPPY